MQTKPKKVHRTSRIVLLTLILLFCSTTLAYAARRSGFTSFDFPGAFETHGQGITAAGEIVGVYAPMANSFVHGFVLHNGNFTAFDVPGADFTDVGWINSRGLAALAIPVRLAAQEQNQKPPRYVADLGTLGGTFGEANA